MKYCPKCLKVIKDKFCKDCGAQPVNPQNDTEKLILIKIIVEEANESIATCSGTKHAGSNLKFSKLKPGAICPRCTEYGFAAFDKIAKIVNK